MSCRVLAFDYFDMKIEAKETHPELYEAKIPDQHIVIYIGARPWHRFHMTVCFDEKNPNPELWAKILASDFSTFEKQIHNLPQFQFTKFVTIEVNCEGCRIRSGNGAIDGRLQDPYQKVVEEVNQKREALGYRPIAR